MTTLDILEAQRYRIDGPNINGQFFVFEHGRDLYPAAGPFATRAEAEAWIASN